MRARYYNIDIKRFINQDILTGSIESSKSLNRYAYVEGNPISYLDPFGMQKSMLDEAHEFIGKLIGILTAINIGIIVGDVAFTAFGFVGALPVAADLVFTINKVIDILTIMDTIILAFDMIKNRHNAEKCFRDLRNIGGNLFGIAVEINCSHMEQRKKHVCEV